MTVSNVHFAKARRPMQDTIAWQPHGRPLDLLPTLRFITDGEIDGRTWLTAVSISCYFLTVFEATYMGRVVELFVRALHEYFYWLRAWCSLTPTTPSLMWSRWKAGMGVQSLVGLNFG